MPDVDCDYDDQTSPMLQRPTPICRLRIQHSTEDLPRIILSIEPSKRHIVACVPPVLETLQGKVAETLALASTSASATRNVDAADRKRLDTRVTTGLVFKLIVTRV